MIFPTVIPPSSPPAFVLDVSVAAASGIPMRYTVYAHRVQLRLALGTAALIATNWPLALVEELLAAVLRGDTTRQRTDSSLATLSSCRIYLDTETPHRAWSEVLDLARTHGILARDAAHLELALRTGLPLATIDPALTSAASAVSVPIFAP